MISKFSLGIATSIFGLVLNAFWKRPTQICYVIFSTEPATQSTATRNKGILPVIYEVGVKVKLLYTTFSTEHVAQSITTHNNVILPIMSEGGLWAKILYTAFSTEHAAQ